MLALAVAALLQEPGLWDGFEAGSWIRMSYLSLRQDPPAPWADARTERTADGLREAWKGQTPVLSAPPERARLTDGFRETARRREKLAIRDRLVACEVVEYQPLEPLPNHTLVLTLWRAGDVAVPPREAFLWNSIRRVPVDVVALTVVNEAPRSAFAVGRRVVDLDVPLEIGGRRLSCVAEQGSSTHVNGGSYARRDFTQWLSAEVPGGLVRKDRDCTADPQRPLHSYTLRDEVLDFHVVR